MAQPPATAHSKRSSQVTVGSVAFGGDEFAVIAGPCSIESLEQFSEISKAVKENGACMLRGGIFKMRTNPSSFQGLGPAAYPIAAEVRAAVGIPLVSEITDPRQIGSLGEAVDMFQVGARNMYNYELLKELGQTEKPVLLKRSFSAPIDEWLSAADYIRRGGNRNVVLCERGIRSFERATRNTLDLGAVAYIKANTDFPVIVDPSHGVGIRNLIAPMCLAAAAAGADGLLLEVHPNPLKALSDSAQQLTVSDFAEMMKDLGRVLNALGKRIQHP